MLKISAGRRGASKATLFSILKKIDFQHSFAKIVAEESPDLEAKGGNTLLAISILHAINHMLHMNYETLNKTKSFMYDFLNHVSCQINYHLLQLMHHFLATEFVVFWCSFVFFYNIRQFIHIRSLYICRRHKNMSANNLFVIKNLSLSIKKQNLKSYFYNLSHVIFVLGIFNSYITYQ